MSSPTDTPESTPTGAPEAGGDKPAGGPCSGRCHGRGHRRRGVRRALGLLLLVGALVGVPLAVANAAGGHGWGDHGCGKHEAPRSAQELREHMERGKGLVLGRLDATGEQEAQVDAVLDRVAPELFALKDDHEALRQDLRAALTAPSIDPAEVESIRADGLKLADEASRVVLGAVVEVARVLTPEQRAELAEAAERWHR